MNTPLHQNRPEDTLNWTNLYLERDDYRIRYVNVVVQLYPWFKFSFLLFLGMIIYDNNIIISLKQKKRKFEPRMKLNHNINIDLCHQYGISVAESQTFLLAKRPQRRRARRNRCFCRLQVYKTSRIPHLQTYNVD